MIIAAIVAATVVVSALQPGHRPPPRSGLQGSPLLRAFWGSPDYDGRLKLSLAEASSEARSEIEKRLARGNMFTSRLPVVTTDNATEKELASKRRFLERAAVTMLGAPSVAAEAARYAASYPAHYEWEGDPGAPMGEAQFADGYVRAHPQRALRPFLYVLMLRLYRSAFEAASWTSDTDIKRQAADGYLRAWERAMQSPDVVIRAVANDIDAEAFLYIGDQGHPRTWGRK